MRRGRPLVKSPEVYLKTKQHLQKPKQRALAETRLLSFWGLKKLFKNFQKILLTNLTTRLKVLRTFAARQGAARQGRARQGRARQGTARQGTARQGKARQGSFSGIDVKKTGFFS